MPRLRRIQAAAPRHPLKSHGRRKGILASTRGQSTVEFAIVLAAFLAMATAGLAFWHAVEEGRIAEHALAAESRSIENGGVGAMADVFLT